MGPSFPECLTVFTLLKHQCSGLGLETTAALKPRADPDSEEPLENQKIHTGGSHCFIEMKFLFDISKRKAQSAVAGPRAKKKGVRPENQRSDPGGCAMVWQGGAQLNWIQDFDLSCKLQNFGKKCGQAVCLDP